jgi:hypothetical protein
MNLGTALTIYDIPRSRKILGGGEGSGPNAPCPQCGPGGSTIGPHHSGMGEKSHKLEEGDIVRLKVPVKLYNEKTGNNDNVSNAKGVIVSVLPKVGHADQQVKVQVISPSKHHENDYMQYMKMNDVVLHKPKGVEDIPKERLDIKPVRPSQTIIKFETADGASVAWVKPHVAGEEDIKSLKQIAEDKHSMKGQFAQIDVVKGIQDRPGFSRVSRMYDTSNLPAHFQKGSGASIWVDSYIKKGAIKEVKISEQNYSKYSQKSRGILTFSYKNAAKAVGMLKSRYGIVTKLSRLRVKK